MKIILLALLSASFCLPLFAQPQDTLWTRTYYDLRDTRFNAVCATPDGGCAAAGFCCMNLYHGFYASAFAARVDVYGNTVWEHHYWLAWGNVQAPFVEGFAVQPVETGGLVMGIGASGWPPFGAPLLHVNDDGVQEWVTLCNPEQSDPHLKISSICSASDGGFAATLVSQYEGARVAYVDSDGHLLWRRASPAATLCTILPLTDGFLVAGGPGFFLAQLGSTGDSLWTRCFTEDSASICNQLIARPSGGYLMIGGITDQAAIVIVDDDGNLLNTHTYAFATAFLSGVHCFEGGYLLLSDRLVRLNEDLDTLWTRTMPCNDCSSTSVTQTTDSGFVVAGYIAGFSSDSAYLVKFSREGLPTDGRTVFPPSSFILSCFPNPFNPSTTISFTVPRAGRVKLAVFDLLGREVQVLSDNMMTAGEHRVLFDGSSLPSGIYFARMQSGEFAATKKLLLLK